MLVIGGGITGAGIALDAATRGLAHGTGRTRRLRLRYVVEEFEDDPRRPALPPARRCPAGLRGPPRAAAPARQRPPPRVGAAVPDPGADQGRLDLEEDRQGARLGAVDVRPDRRVADRQAPPAARRRPGARPLPHDAGRQAVVGVRLLRRRRRRRPSHAHDRPHGRDARSRRRQPLRRRRTHQGRRRAGPTAPSSTPAASRIVRVPARVVVSPTGVWADTIRALDEGDRPGVAPTGQGRPHHGAVAAGPQRHRRDHLRCPATSAACSSCRGARSPTAPSNTATSARPTPTSSATSTTRSTNDDDLDYLLQALQQQSDQHDHARRRDRRVGGPPAAREASFDRDAPPTSPAATASPSASPG